MANKKVSELSPLDGIQDSDLIEITKYMGAGLGDGGGDYKSYKTTWETFKSSIHYREIVILDNNGEGIAEYTPAQFELIESFVSPQAEGVGIAIVHSSTGETLMSSHAGDTAGSIMFLATDNNPAGRAIFAQFSEDYGRIYLFVTKNLNP